MTEKTLLVEREVLHLYRTIDEVVDKALKVNPVTCKPKCCYCCYMPTVVGVGEGLVISQEILRRPGWEDWAKKLQEASKLYCKEEFFNRRAYFESKIPCPFLESNECLFYSRRPACCRLLYAVGPIEKCHFDYTGNDVPYLDLLKFERKMWELNQAINPTPVAAPLPLMVLFTMGWTNKARAKVLLDYREGLLDPVQWAKKYIVNGNYDHDERESQRILKSINESNI